MSIDGTIQRLLIASLLSVVGYYLIPRRWQVAWLLLASYLFYVTWQWQQALILAALTIINYGLGLILPGVQSGVRRLLVILGISVNVGVLILSKYGLLNFSLTLMQSDAAASEPISPIIPLSLSFIILHTISYLVDVANDRIKPVRNPLHFALYLAYFPKLIAGPIERVKTFIPQLEAPRFIDDERVLKSLYWIGLGLLRKSLIADLLMSLIPSEIWQNPAGIGGLQLGGYLLMYAFAIYNDFAGYSSLAYGLSGLFGIELSANFRFPYSAWNLTDFWNRWHISFSQWLRDYIFFPLSRALAKRIPDRRHPIHLIVPPLTTMLISGLWHGANLHMVLWGVLHGIALIIQQIWFNARKPLPVDKQPIWLRGLSTLATFSIVTLLWLPFRTTVPDSIEFLSAIVSQPLGGSIPLALIPLAALAVIIDIIESRGVDSSLLRWGQFARAGVVAVVFLLILANFLAVHTTTFVYQGF